MRLIQFFADRPLAAHLLVVLLVGWGVIEIWNAPIDVYPQLPLYSVSIITTWHGASAADVELLVTEKIETHLEGIPGIQHVTSRSQNGLSIISIEIESDLSNEEFESRVQEIQSALAAVSDLPREADRPIVSKASSDDIAPLIQVVVYDSTEDPAELAGLPESRRQARQEEREAHLRSVTRDLQEELEGVPGVRKVKADGLRDREIAVEVDRRRIDHYGLTLEEVAAALQSDNQNLPAGSLDLPGASKHLTASADLLSPDHLLGRIIARQPDGSHVYLADVAEVEFGFKPSVRRTYWNGRFCQSLWIVKDPEASALEVVGALREVLERYREERMPAGVEITTANDSTVMIRNRLSVLGNNLAQGVVLVVLLLGISMGIRNSLLVTIGEPFCFISAFVILGPLGVSINALSLFAMILLSGMLVDDGIVVVESIYAKLEKGVPLSRAVVEGTWEVAGPVTSSAATTAAAFLPLLLMGGVTGQFLVVIPLTVTAVLLVSLLECFVLLPGHYLDFGSRSATATTAIGRGFERVTRWTVERVAGIVERLVRRRYVVLPATLGIVAVIAALGRQVRVEMFPADFNQFYLNVNTRPGSTLEDTQRSMAALEEAFRPMLEEGGIESYTTTIGVGPGPDGHYVIRPTVGQFVITAPIASSVPPEEVLAELRRRLDEARAGGHPDLERISDLKTDIAEEGPPLGKPISVRVTAADYEDAREVANRIRAALEGMPGVVDVGTSLERGSDEVHMMLRREQAAALDLQFEQVARAFQLANQGRIVSSFRDRSEGEDVDVRIRLAEEYRRSLPDLMEVAIRLPSGDAVPLRDVGEIDVRRGYMERYHYDGKRILYVNADVVPGQATSTSVNQALQAREVEFLHGIARVDVAFGGEFEETRRSFTQMLQLFGLSLFLVYGLLSIQFDSGLQPLIIMSVIPLSAVAVFLGLIVLGQPFTITAFFAMVALGGIAVNGSIVLVDRVNRNLRERGDARDPETLAAAVREGVASRCRPILLTAITTVVGLLPMALGTGGGSKVWSPFATTISFGVIASTVLTLFVVPCIYAAVGDTSRVLGTVFRGRSSH